MKIGVMSDSHDRIPAIRRAIGMFHRLKVGAILHAGDFVAPFAAKVLVEEHDIPLHCIYGNNDGERVGLKKVLPQVVDGPLRLTLGGKTIVMHHWIEWFKPGETDGADIVISGHTHEIVQEKKNGVLYLNPGEVCGWLTNRCTAMVLDTDTMTAEVIDVHD
jgi:hypothetical protein